MVAFRELTKAELAASQQVTAGVLAHLKPAGRWALDFAQKAEKNVAAEAMCLSGSLNRSLAKWE